MTNKLMFPVILILILLIAIPENVQAQDSCNDYVMLQDNAQYEILTYSNKDKLQSRAVYHVKDVDNSGNKVEATIATKVFDPKDKQSSGGEFKIGCDDGTVWMDMQSMINQEMMGAEEMEMSMQGDRMLYPKNLTAGQKLKDGAMTIEMKEKGSGKTFSVMTMKIMNRTVEGKEKVQVPAGTYNAYKISQDTEMENRAMGVKMPGMRMQTIEYYVPKIGMVRSEAYRNGKLISYSVLSKLSK
jgi:hypothetical protein